MGKIGLVHSLIGVRTADLIHSAVKAFQNEQKDTSTAIELPSPKSYMYEHVHGRGGKY